MFNKMTKGLDKTDNAVVRYSEEQLTWFFVIPTNTPELLERTIREAYAEQTSNDAMGTSTESRYTPEFRDNGDDK
jgi:hypothetical protein